MQAGKLQNLSGKPFLKLYHQSSQHAKYSFDQHSQCETSQVALEDELHSNKQGLLCLRCHCLGLGYVMHVHSLCLPFLTSHANLQFFWPKVCHACRQIVLALFNFTRQLAVFLPKVVFPRWGTYCKVLLMRLETLSPVPGHTVDSLGGTPATFMVEAWQGLGC